MIADEIHQHFYENEYRGHGWTDARNARLKKDNYRCQYKGCTHKIADGELHVHHIIPYRCFAYGDPQANNLSNLISYCKTHHWKVEKQNNKLRTHPLYRKPRRPKGHQEYWRRKKKQYIQINIEPRQFTKEDIERILAKPKQKKTITAPKSTLLWELFTFFLVVGSAFGIVWFANLIQIILAAN